MVSALSVRDRDAKIQAVLAAREDLDRIVSEATGGGVVLARNWYPQDNWFWSMTPLRTLEDFKGKKVRIFSTSLGLFISGLGAGGQFVAFSEVATALERGILDAALTFGATGISWGWHEVARYLVGPIPDRAHTWAVVNKDVWDSFPTDIQRILLEVGEDYEIESLKRVEQWEAEAVAQAKENGMEVIPFSPEVADTALQVALDVIVPNWVERAGGADSEAGQKAIKLWNDHFANRLGIRINEDGTAEQIG